uniref:DegT/DnrJ/EryC1/StrS family aminotransferase n=1 Tax=candidate division WOR-3 bacterium TaxID=2052148 RepID=A0A7C4GA00_UNCW3
MQSRNRPERIPLAGSLLGPAERRLVLSVLRSGRLALGPLARRFERQLARFIGVRHAVAVSSGTAGLHLVVRALGLTEGDEVITTPFSFVASTNCLLYERVQPVFVDIDPRTLNLDPARVEAAVTPRTRAILGVDVFGLPADWPALRQIARRHSLALIEDSCEALGSRLGRVRCGAFGDAGVFAFYPNKQLTTGEGGMVVTDSRRIADACRSMANQGRRAAAGNWLEHTQLGYNYRLDELSAALGLAQLGRLRLLLSRRRRIATEYCRLLAAEPGIILPSAPPGTEVSWFVFVVRLTTEFNGADRNRILAALRRRGIECSDYFRPIHLQPFFRRRFGFRRGDFPLAEAAADRTIALPFAPNLTRRQVCRVAAELRRAIATVKSDPPARRPKGGNRVQSS